LEGEFSARYQNIEWTQSLAGQDGVFLLRYVPTLRKEIIGREGGQIIRANVNGTREVILYESDVFYVPPI